jgi:DNA-directed RNA polymerase specialized sigma24 family protein
LEDSRPITAWLARLKSGDDEALQPLWNRYYSEIVRLARRRLPRAGDLDSEVIAASAFHSFWRGARAGRFPQLRDRHDLWRLLIFITEQKIADSLERRNAQKRGGGRVNQGDEQMRDLTSSVPTPDFVLLMVEELEALLNCLGNEQLRKIAVWKMEGESNREIAKRLDCALRTVSYKLDLIRATLRKRQNA